MPHRTIDLHGFDTHAIRGAARLLMALAEDPRFRWTCDGFRLEYHEGRGSVFLIGLDEEIYTLRSGKSTLEELHHCPHCGAEGFEDTLHINTTANELPSGCIAYLVNLGVVGARVELVEHDNDGQEI